MPGMLGDIARKRTLARLRGRDPDGTPPSPVAQTGQFIPSGLSGGTSGPYVEHAWVARCLEIKVGS